MHIHGTDNYDVSEEQEVDKYGRMLIEDLQVLMLTASSVQPKLG